MTPKARRPMLRWVAIILSIALGFICGLTWEQSRHDHWQPSSIHAILNPQRDAGNRSAAAADLANRSPDGDAIAWMCFLILDDTLIHEEALVDNLEQFPLEARLYESIILRDLSVVWSLIHELDATAHPTVLWCLTTRLDDARTCPITVPFRGASPLGRGASGETPAIRDECRRVLHAALGVDHGYDTAAWRSAIREHLKSID